MCNPTVLRYSNEQLIQTVIISLILDQIQRSNYCALRCAALRMLRWNVSGVLVALTIQQKRTGTRPTRSVNGRVPVKGAELYPVLDVPGVNGFAGRRQPLGKVHVSVAVQFAFVPVHGGCKKGADR
jgi:hypothetical protein